MGRSVVYVQKIFSMTRVNNIRQGFEKKNVTLTTCYGKYSIISNTFLFLLFNKMLLLTAGIHEVLIRIVNREDPD